MGKDFETISKVKSVKLSVFTNSESNALSYIYIINVQVPVL